MKKANKYILDRVKLRNENRKLYNEICKNYSYCCAVCGSSVPTVTGKRINRQNGCDLHHITPYIENGEQTKENLILLCGDCHIKADNNTLTRDYLRSKVVTTAPGRTIYLRQQYLKAKENNSLQGHT